MQLPLHGCRYAVVILSSTLRLACALTLGSAEILGQRKKVHVLVSSYQLLHVVVRENRHASVHSKFAMLYKKRLLSFIIL